MFKSPAAESNAWSFFVLSLSPRGQERSAARIHANPRGIHDEGSASEITVSSLEPATQYDW